MPAAPLEALYQLPDVERPLIQRLGNNAWTGLAHRAINRATLGAILTGSIAQGSLVVSGTLAARMLGPENRGYLALIAIFPPALAQLGSCGLPLAATYYIGQNAQRAAKVIRLLARPALLQAGVVIALHLVIVLVLFRERPHDIWIAAVISLAAGPGLLAQQYGLAILQGRRNFASFNVLWMLSPILYAAGTVLLFVIHGGFLLAVTLAWVASQVAAGILAVVLGIHSTQRNDRSSEPLQLRPMLAFGLRGLFGSSSPVDLFRIDQAVVGIVLSPAALGLYVVGVAFMVLPRFLAERIGAVAYPTVAAQPDPGLARRSMWKYFFVAMAVCLPVVALLEIGAGPLVRFFFGSAFTEAIPLVRTLLVGAVFLSARRILSEGVRGLGYPGKSTVAELISWLFLLPALLLLSPRFGVEGAAFAYSASYAVSLAMLLVLIAPPNRWLAAGAGR